MEIAARTFALVGPVHRSSHWRRHHRTRRCSLVFHHALTECPVSQFPVGVSGPFSRHRSCARVDSCGGSPDGRTVWAFYYRLLALTHVGLHTLRWRVEPQPLHCYPADAALCAQRSSPYCGGCLTVHFRMGGLCFLVQCPLSLRGYAGGRYRSVPDSGPRYRAQSRVEDILEGEQEIGWVAAVLTVRYAVPTQPGGRD